MCDNLFGYILMATGVGTCAYVLVYFIVDAIKFMSNLHKVANEWKKFKTKYNMSVFTDAVYSDLADRYAISNLVNEIGRIEQEIIKLQNNKKKGKK